MPFLESPEIFLKLRFCSLFLRNQTRDLLLPSSSCNVNIQVDQFVDSYLHSVRNCLSNLVNDKRKSVACENGG